MSEFEYSVEEDEPSKLKEESKGLQLHDLSQDQREAYHVVLNWALYNTTSKPILRLGGYGGTGKSALLGVFARESGIEPVAYCAFTGKASSVLRKKLLHGDVRTRSRVLKRRGDEGPDNYYETNNTFQGLPYCGTIHGLIYQPKIDEKTGRVTKWELREELDAPYKLIVVDEASMVSDEMLGHLRSYGIQILMVGDHGQLPPVGGAGSLMQNPDVRLERIHRQAENNPIIKLGAEIRKTGVFNRKLADGEHVFFGPMHSLRYQLEKRYKDTTGEALFRYATLCYTNRRRATVNQITRNVMKLNGAPKKGEQVICLRNQRQDTGTVYNGMRGLILTDTTRHPSYPWQIRAEVDFVEDDVRANVTMCAQQFGQDKTFNDFSDVEKALLETTRKHFNIFNWGEVGGLYDFAYGMTVHKCVAPETLVETPHGLEMIGDVDDSGEVATPSGRANYVSVSRNAVGSMLSISTRDGYVVKTTPYHGLDVWTKDGYVRTEAGNISQYDMVRLRLFAEFDAPNSKLPTTNAPDVRAKQYVLPHIVTDDVALFLGLMVADGTVYDSGFRLAKRHKEVADTFADLCIKLFDVEPPKRFFTLNAHHVEVNSSYIASWLRGIGGLSPNAKDVPRCILQSSNRAQALFLRGLFEDGTVNLKDDTFDHIELHSFVNAIVRKVRVMLLRQGIISGATVNRPGHIYIYSDGIEEFASKIGFISEFKSSRLPTTFERSKRYPVPFTTDEMSRIAASAGKRSNLPSAAKNAFSNGTMSRHATAKMLRQTKNDEIKTLLEEKLSFHHSRVLDIQKYEGPSMCLTVPYGHQFIQDGFCGWNSQGSGIEDVLVLAERPGPVDEDTWRRWKYTAVSRAISRVTVLE